MCDACYVSDILNVRVEAGSTAMADLLLYRESFLEGRIIDERGAPVEGARVSAAPAGNGVMSSAGSSSNGLFRLCLYPDEQYTLTVEASGYAPWNSDSTLYASGRAPAEFVLSRGTEKHFQLIDASTNRPITEFAFAIRAKENLGQPSPYASDGEFKVAHHEQGVVSCPSDPLTDDAVVDAPGYARIRVPVAASPDDLQLIALRRGWRICGIARLNGEVTDSAIALLYRSAGRKRASPTTLPYDSVPVPATYDLDTFVGESRLARGNAYGEFVFESVPAGTWDLEIRATGAGSTFLEPLAINRDITLGIVELDPESIIEGRLEPPPVAGVVACLGSWEGGKSCILGDRGEFVFRGLSAGVHVLTIDPARKSLDPPLVRRVAVKRGEHVQVVLPKQ
jgi:hypothetical protein